MPTYEYFCDANNQSVEVLHSMHKTLSTWGELCDCAGIDIGKTEHQASIEKKLSAVSLLPKKDVSSKPQTGCCGGGCGCGH